MRVDRASRIIAAQADRIYRALTNAEAVRTWLPPAGARGVIDVFEPRPGGAFRMTLIFDKADGTERKSSADSDVVNGQFVELAPNARVRQRFSFESDNPAFAGEMDITWTLAQTAEGVLVTVTAENVPAGITPEDHQAGMASSLDNLARYLR